jgi:hypothetical protein
MSHARAPRYRLPSRRSADGCPSLFAPFIGNRLRSVTRRVLTIGYQARSPKTRDALVESYRKLTATTRAVLRDADTMVRRLGQTQD